jgi:capsular exopolysaccharide synthesis family protein
VKAESENNSIRTGSLEAVQASSQADQLSALQQRLNDARQQFAQVKTTYGANHPLFKKAAADVTEMERQYASLQANIAARIDVGYKRALNREAMLQLAVGETKKEFDDLNSRSFQYQRLKQEADADKTLYDELIKKIQESRINAGFQSDNIRVADVARPPLKPYFPNPLFNGCLAFVGSLLFAVTVAIILDFTDTTVHDSESARLLGTDLVGVLPAVKSKQLERHDLELSAPHPRQAAADPAAARSGLRSLSAFEEAIRTLRNTIIFSNFDRDLRSLLLTSAAPGEGKTTTAIYLAIANAQQQKRTLLVDADLRRPTIHSRLNLKSDSGLSAVISGQEDWKGACVEVPGIPLLDVLPAGIPSRRAADLVGPILDDILRQAQSEYDLVIVDAPPLLGFAESLQLCTMCDGALVVSRAASTNKKAILAVLSSLRRLRVNVVGLVLNGVKANREQTYGYYGYYAASDEAAV